NYTVTATNASGSATATVNITVQDLRPVFSYTTVVDTFRVGEAVTKNKTSTGGPITSWSISPALPAGLVFNTTTGNISGTPTAASAAANYTVTATGTYGNASVVLNITVLPSVSVAPGAFVFRVTGAEKPYTFVLPATSQETEAVTMTIT